MNPPIGSILLGSTDPGRLRAWYETAFDMKADGDGFLRFGEVGVLIDGRDDVAPRAAEPRVIINLHVKNARTLAERLDGLGVTWITELEYREAGGAWFATLEDPDGNVLQLIELGPDYWRLRRERLGHGHGGLLGAAAVASRLPAQDLERARAFYAAKLGLEPAEERPGGLLYHCQSGSFALFQSAGRPSGDHTQMAWRVDDLDRVVAELRERGVEFEEFDMPGFTAVNGVVEVRGDYPSHGGVGERAVWFRDSEGNLLGVGQSI
ncbi:VOC family protein [Spirillospora sp. NPDC047279]|uniref:VOC family protein n=1 Tax=Spirillospora sp. NPDC047279 TaxID=3155478 RepID=UPI0033C161E8